jgi:hypothetical protein
LNSIKAMGFLLNYSFKETDVTEAEKDELHEVFDAPPNFGGGLVGAHISIMDEEEAKGVAVKDLEQKLTLHPQDSIL